MGESVFTAIQRWPAAPGPEPAIDELAVEEPLEIRFDGRPVSVTMRTPGQDAELAAGFLLSEGLITRAADVAAIESASDHAGINRSGHGEIGDSRALSHARTPAPDCNVVNVRLAAGVRFDFERLTRHVFASSSCGLCGKGTIDAIRQQFPPIVSNLTVDPVMLLELPEKLREAQSVFERTGGLHAAAVFDRDGTLITIREDIGRHNAVDKVLGYGLLNGGMPFDEHVLFVSGRASFEILQKALAGRIPIIAAVSAASSLAVQFAEESNQTLIGFLRKPGMNMYTGAARITSAKP